MAMTKGNIIRAAFAHVVGIQNREGNFDRSMRTVKALSLLHIKKDEIANEVYLAALYDFIKSHEAPV